MTSALVLMLCTLTAPHQCERVDTWVRLPAVACRGVQGQLAALEWMQLHGETRRLLGWACETGQAT